MNLSDGRPIFIGMKMDSQLKRRIASLAGPDSKYVSADDSTFLMLGRLGEDEYVGKLVTERMTTDRVDDVRRNVLSILQRVCPDTRFPAQLEILAVELPAEAAKAE